MERFLLLDGTVTNIEGRVQKVNRIIPGPGQSRALWSILDELSSRMGGQLGAGDGSSIAKEIALVAPAYRSMTWDRLEWGPERDGVVMPDGDGVQELQFVHDGSGLRPTGGRLALHSGRVLFDGGTRNSESPALAALAAEPAVYLHPRDASALALVAGQDVDVSGEFGSVRLPLELDPTLAEGSAYVPANLDSTWVLGIPDVVTIEAHSTTPKQQEKKKNKKKAKKKGAGE